MIRQILALGAMWLGLAATGVSAFSGDNSTIDIVDYARNVMHVDPATLQDWQPVIVAATQSNTKIIFPPGTYPIQTPIVILQKSNFMLEGNGADLVWQGSEATAPLLAIQQCGQVRIQDLGFDGRAYTGPVVNADGLRIDRSDNTTVTGCYVRNVNGNGVTGYRSSACIIENNQIENCWLHGVLVGIPDTGSGDPADNTIIRGNRIETVHNGHGIKVAANASDQETANTITGTVITGNIVENAGGFGIESGVRAIGTVISDNRLISCSLGSIRLRDNRSAIVIGNYCSSDAETTDCANVTVDCALSANGIRDAHSLIEGNTIIGGGNGGIAVAGVNWIAVKNNLIKDAPNRGIALSSSSYDTVNGNIISNQVNIGIGLYNTLTKDDIRGNRIEMNDNNSESVGIKVYTGTTLTDCRIQDNNVFGTCGYSYRAFDGVTVINSDFSGNRYLPGKVPQGFESFVTNEETVSYPAGKRNVVCTSLRKRERCFVYVSTTDNSEYCLLYIQADGTCRALPAQGNLGGTADSSKKWQLCNLGTDASGKYYGLKGNFTSNPARTFVVKVFQD